MTSAELRDTWWGHQPGDLDLASLVPGAARPMMRRVRDRDVIWIDVDEPGDVVRLSATTSAKIEYGLTAARDSGLPVVLVLSSAGADIIRIDDGVVRPPSESVTANSRIVSNLSAGSIDRAR